MNHNHRSNPLHVAALCATLVLAMVMLLDPLFPPSPFESVGAVGGYDAVDLLGQVDGGGNPDYFSGEINNDGSGVPNAQGFRQPYDSVVDTTDHRLFVSDKINSRVLIFDLDANDELVDRTADYVIGQTDFTTGTGGTTKRKLSAQAAIAYDDTGNRLFAADALNHRVMVFDVSLANLASDGNGTDAINVLGQADFVTGTNGTTQSRLFAPNGVAYDALGNRLFVVEEGNNRVTVFDVAAITDGEPAVNVLGQTLFTTATPGTTQSTLTNPRRATFDADVLGGRLFVSDTENNRVMVWDLTGGIVNGEPADSVLGQTDFVTGTSGITQSKLTRPEGVAYDSSGDRLFVADRPANRVMIFDVADIDDGEDATDVYGQTDFTSFSSATTQSGLSAPRGVQWVGTRLYVADADNNRLMIFEEIPPVSVTPHEATDDLGQLTGADEPDLNHSGVNNSPNSRGFNGPTHVAVDTVNHRLFVADYSNSRVLEFDLDTDNLLVDRIADHVLGQQDFRSFDPGTTESTLNGQTDVLYDGENDLLYVADDENNRVMVFDVEEITDGEDAVSVLGQDDFTSSAPAATQDGMATPDSLALDSGGDRLFVGDFNNERVLVFDLSDGIDDGEPAVNVLGKDDFTTSTQDLDRDGLNRVDGVAYDSVYERLFVDDAGNNRIMVFDVDPAVLIPNNPLTDGPDAINVLGQEDFVSAVFTGGPDGMFTPSGVAYDELGERLFVDDYNNHRITVFDTDPLVLVPLAPADPCTSTSCGPDAINVLGQTNFTDNSPGLSASQMDGPYGIEYDPTTSLLYAAEDVNGRVSVWDVTEPITNGAPMVDLLGQLDENDEPIYTTGIWDNQPNAQGFDSPHGAALDSVNHRLFTVEFNNRRVLVFNLNTDNTLEDRTADFVIGQPDIKSTDSGLGDPQAYSFNGNPQSLVYDEVNDLLYVNDANGARVLVFDTSALSNGMSASFVLGQEDFTSGDCCTATADRFLSSEGLALNSSASLLFVPDGFHNRVLVFDVADIDNGEDASFVLGQSDFSADSPGTSSSSMNGPSGASVDSVHQRLFIADNGNNRVLVFDISGGISNGMAASNVLGQDDFTSSGDELSQSGMSAPRALLYEATLDELFVTDSNVNRILVFDTADIDNGEDAVDVYGQHDFSSGDCGDPEPDTLCAPVGLEYDPDRQILFIADAGLNRILLFGATPTPTPTPTPGGGGNNNPPPPGIGFTPIRIEVNQDSSVTDSRNVLVTVYATNTNSFTGTVDVLLSNDPLFSTYAPFRYNIPESQDGRSVQNIWPKTIAWDLCFGLKEGTPCDPGRKTVYARFYVNVPAPSPAFTPAP